MLSIVIPIFNEQKHGYLDRILTLLSKTQHEIICVDSYSTDDTVHIVDKYNNTTLYQIKTNSRAARLNYGIKKSSSAMILLHHPRSLLNLDGLIYLDENQQHLKWGAYSHAFDGQHPLLKFTSWYSNIVRGDIKQIYYLDHCIFAQKKLLQKINYLPELEIFEDTELCKRLQTEAKGHRLPYNVLTSSARFQINGLWKQVLLNQWMKILYAINVDHRKINKQYEKGLGFNSKI